jgi:hypothetical protein
MQAGFGLCFDRHQDLESCFLDPGGLDWSVVETGEHGVALCMPDVGVVPYQNSVTMNESVDLFHVLMVEICNLNRLQGVPSHA